MVYWCLMYLLACGSWAVELWSRKYAPRRAKAFSGEFSFTVSLAVGCLFGCDVEIVVFSAMRTKCRSGRGLFRASYTSGPNSQSGPIVNYSGRLKEQDTHERISGSEHKTGTCVILVRGATNRDSSKCFAASNRKCW